MDGQRQRQPSETAAYDDDFHAVLLARPIRHKSSGAARLDCKLPVWLYRAGGDSGSSGWPDDDRHCEYSGRERDRPRGARWRRPARFATTPHCGADLFMVETFKVWDIFDEQAT
jgi:hypothetical protein